MAKKSFVKSEDGMGEPKSDAVVMAEILTQMSRQNDSIIRMLEQKADVVDAMNALAQAQGMDIVMQNGFTMMAEQLTPLRNLAPPRTPLSGDAPERLANLRASLDREDLGRLQGLRLDVQPVAFIGAVAPPLVPQGSTLDVLFASPDKRMQRGESE